MKGLRPLHASLGTQQARPSGKRRRNGVFVRAMPFLCMRLQPLCDENFRKFSLDRSGERGWPVDNLRPKVGITFSIHRHFPPPKSEKREKPGVLGQKSVDNSVDNVDILKKRTLRGIHALYPTQQHTKGAGKPRKRGPGRKRSPHKNAKADFPPAKKWG